MSCPTLRIDDVIVPIQSMVEFEQNYDDGLGQQFRRTADGTGYLRTAWFGKVATQINGTGWAPSAFGNLDPSITHKLFCAVPRTVSDVSNVITIPANRRSDPGHEPYGYALVDGYLIETGFDSVVGETFTLTPVAGASGYRCNYFPEITCAVIDNTSSKLDDGSYQWSISAEEI